jgi:acyl-CoA synthetase (AMP-forming)/AMP-acid ligase II
LVGGSTVAVKSDVGMFNFWKYVHKYGAHWSLGMVSFLGLLLSRKDGPIAGGMRGLLTGGSAIDAGLVREFESRFGVPVRTVYGLTESSSIATCEFRDPTPRALGSSGRPLPLVDVRIVGESGDLLPADDPLSRRPGEIWISGPTIFDRYIADPEMTASRKRGAWLQTGDLGYFDNTGNLFVVDRLDSMLIVGGENVYPAEVERLCTQLPGAAQIVLTGVNNRIWGKELVLVYKAESGASPSTRKWHAILGSELASFKLPWRYVSIEELGLEEFPRKTNGKLDRQAIATALTALMPARYSKKE